MKSTYQFNHKLGALTQAGNATFLLYQQRHHENTYEVLQQFDDSTGETNMFSLAESEPALQFCALVFL